MQFASICYWFTVPLPLQGIVRALREYQQRLIDGKVKIFVRRAGPNFQEGLRIMRELGECIYSVSEYIHRLFTSSNTRAHRYMALQ